nr:STAS domain-containing protein [Kineococcus vitellinus]
MAGEVDACLGPVLGRGVEEALATGLPVLVRADGVTSMDSTGLGFLARLASRSAERRITVTGAPDVVRHLVHRARLEGVVELVDGPGEAGGAR